MTFTITRVCVMVVVSFPSLYSNVSQLVRFPRTYLQDSHFVCSYVLLKYHLVHCISCLELIYYNHIHIHINDNTCEKVHQLVGICSVVNNAIVV